MHNNRLKPGRLTPESLKLRLDQLSTEMRRPPPEETSLHQTLADARSIQTALAGSVRQAEAQQEQLEAAQAECRQLAARLATAEGEAARLAGLNSELRQQLEREWQLGELFSERERRAQLERAALAGLFCWRRQADGMVTGLPLEQSELFGTAREPGWSQLEEERVRLELEDRAEAAEERADRLSRQADGRAVQDQARLLELEIELEKNALDSSLELEESEARVVEQEEAWRRERAQLVALSHWRVVRRQAEARVELARLAERNAVLEDLVAEMQSSLSEDLGRFSQEKHRLEASLGQSQTLFGHLDRQLHRERKNRIRTELEARQADEEWGECDQRLGWVAEQLGTTASLANSALESGSRAADTLGVIGAMQASEEMLDGLGREGDRCRRLAEALEREKEERAQCELLVAELMEFPQALDTALGTIAHLREQVACGSSGPSGSDATDTKPGEAGSEGRILEKLRRVVAQIKLRQPADPLERHEAELEEELAEQLDGMNTRCALIQSRLVNQMLELSGVEDRMLNRQAATSSRIAELPGAEEFGTPIGERYYDCDHAYDEDLA